MPYKEKVFVGLSGGVDSSVTAALLVDVGFDVTGVYIKGWYPDWKECSWKDHRRDAMRVCARLGIPFTTLDASKEYKKEVIDYFLAEYARGRVPNPDVMCNKHIKFGVFYKWAREQGADYVATGHYAKQENGSLFRGADTQKDQSYFLWTLTEEQLRHTLFPLGIYTKDVVRKMAKKFKLPTANKKDSQGICFLEDVSMEEFLAHYIKTQPGVVLDEDGEEIGTHTGALRYTIGQRHGFTTQKISTNEKPYFVVSKDIEKNTITVSNTKPTSVSKSKVALSQTNWLVDIEEGQSYQCQHRYRQESISCVLQKNNGEWVVIPEAGSEVPVSGQSCVIYRGKQCLGGGILDVY